MPLFIILNMLHHSKDTNLPFPLLSYKNFHSILYKIKNWNSDEYDQCSCYTISTSGHIQHSLKNIASPKHNQLKNLPPQHKNIFGPFMISLTISLYFI